MGSGIASFGRSLGKSVGLIPSSPGAPRQVNRDLPEENLSDEEIRRRAETLKGQKSRTERLFLAARQNPGLFSRAQIGAATTPRASVIGRR